MLLLMADIGKKYVVKEIKGGKGARLHLEKLGFVIGSPVEVISKQGGNIIVRVLESRIAIGAGLASKIIV